MQRDLGRRTRIVATLALALGFASSIPAVATSGVSSDTPRLSGADLAVEASRISTGQRLQVTGIDLPATGESIVLEVERFEVFAPDAEIVVHGAGGHVTRLPAPANAYFRGKVAGEPGSRVFLEVLESGQTRGIVTRAGEETHLFDSADANGVAAGRLQAARVDAAMLKAGREPWKCGEEALPPTPSVEAGWDILAAAAASGTLPAPATAPAPEVALYTARVAVETDYEYYTKFNNTTNATNYVGNLLGYASTIYSNEIATSLIVQSVSLWTSSADPWSQTSTTCGLMEFGRYWNINRTGVSRTIAHFLSGKGLGGGIAWLGVLCSGSFGVGGVSCSGLPADANWGGGYGFTASISGTFNINSPTVMWDIVAVAHEIGHNFNSPHGHCYNGIGGSSSPIDQCYGSESGCYSGAASLPGPAGAGSGTIMSYCHLVRSSYSDLSLTFGTGHPYGVLPGREAARMSGYVVSTASGNPSCLALTNPIAIFSSGFETGVVPGQWNGKFPPN